MSVQTLNNVTTKKVYRFVTTEQMQTKGVLTYNATGDYFVFYSLVGGKKFVSFRIEHNINNDDTVYLNEWRLSFGKMYEYDGDNFMEIAPTLYDAENEMAMHFANTIDFTGGIHGDERIDVSPDSFVKFFAGGRLITADDMANDFSMVCDSFAYMQYSTLHETAQEENTFVAGHPIVATHYKKNVFKDGGSHLENIVKLVGSQKVTLFHAGMVCVGKGAGKYVILPTGVLSPELTGTSNDIMATAAIPSDADYWNPETGLACKVTGDFVKGFDNETDIPITGENGFTVWDRGTDSKYYRRFLGTTRQFADGDEIINRQIIQYSV